LGSQTKMLEVGRRRFVTFRLSTLDFSTRIRRNKARMLLKTKDRHEKLGSSPAFRTWRKNALCTRANLSQERPQREKLRKNQPPVILSEAKDPRSFLCFSGLRTTSEILRCAQDDTSRISSHVQIPGSAPLKVCHSERSEVLEILKLMAES